MKRFVNSGILLFTIGINQVTLQLDLYVTLWRNIFFGFQISNEVIDNFNYCVLRPDLKDLLFLRSFLDSFQ